jgi:hypothetical protein
MTTKSKSKSKSITKKTPASKKMEHEAFDAALASFRAATPSPADRRKELLAQVAGSIAGDIINAPPSAAPESSMAASIATIAVDIAEEILKKAGIAPIASSAEKSSAADAAAGAAS